MNQLLTFFISFLFTSWLAANSICESSLNSNPLLVNSQLHLGAFRFDLIKLAHFKPALEHGFLIANQRLEKMIADNRKPSIENTLQALMDLDREFESVEYILSIYSDHLATTENQPLLNELDELSSSMSIELNQKVFSNPILYKKIKALSDGKNLSAAQKKYVQELIESFERNGLNFNPDQLVAFKTLSQKLATVRNSFQNKNLDQDRLKNNYLHVLNKSELIGLSERTLLNGKNNAKTLNLDGWVFSPASGDYIEILDSAEHEPLRFKMWYLASNSNSRGDQYDTSEDVKTIIKTEQELALLQGFPTPAEKHLHNNMAKSAQQVKAFYRGFIKQAFEKAKSELENLQNFKNQRTGNTAPLRQWDYRYWLNQYRKAFFNFDENQLRPYLEYSKVLKGVFNIIKNLYGIEFVQRFDLPTFYPGVQVFELKRAQQSIGLLYLDPFSRDEKKSGAWMGSLVAHEKRSDGQSQPIISIINTDIQKSLEGPTLLRRGDVITLLHEMGHAMHSFASKAENRYQSGTRGVPRDMVELPSQFMENYFFEYDVLKQFATNSQGEPLPYSLFESMIKARSFGQGQSTLQQLLTAGLDIELFSKASIDSNFDILEFEDSIRMPFQLFPKVPEGLIRGKHLNTFSHIMMGGYTAQYYSYLWSEVLAFDAFAAFKETGDVFNPAQAKKFESLLAAGSTKEADVIYREFRGRDLSFEAFLKAKGLSLP